MLDLQYMTNTKDGAEAIKRRVKKNQNPDFKPRYGQIPRYHLKCRSSVIGSFPQWQAKEPQRG